MSTVGIEQLKGTVRYPTKAPFNPPQQYPEIPFSIEPDKSNTVYPLVRELFYNMGLDTKNYGTKNWNPLGSVINQGDKVVLKPNWVLDTSQYDINALITNMSVVRAVADYAWIACGPKGRIDILESPIQKTDWKHLMEVTGAQSTVEYLQEKGVQIDLQDIRTECFIEKDVINLFGWRFKIFYRKKLSGTKKGYVEVDLQKDSMFDEVSEKAPRFRGIQQWTGKDTQKAHNKHHHKYSVPKEILDCNVFINIPKLKTHRKAGVTLTLKNLVGMVNYKDTLPHYVEGTPAKGGDEAPHDRELYVRFIDYFSIFSFFKRVGFSIRPPGIEKVWRKKIEEDLSQLKNVRQANWYGGDTVWRMVYDLNMILQHADSKGKMHTEQQRKYFGVIDGIIGGERFGPLDSVPKKSGLLLAGTDPVALEYVGTRAMGYSEDKIKTLQNVRKAKYAIGTNSFSSIDIRSSNKKWKKLQSDPLAVCLHFEPPPGWHGHLELEKHKENIRRKAQR